MPESKLWSSVGDSDTVSLERNSLSHFSPSFAWYANMWMWCGLVRFLPEDFLWRAELLGRLVFEGASCQHRGSSFFKHDSVWESPSVHVAGNPQEEAVKTVHVCVVKRLVDCSMVSFVDLSDHLIVNVWANQTLFMLWNEINRLGISNHYFTSL